MIKKRILTVCVVMMIASLAGCANPQPYASPTPIASPLPGLVVTPVPNITVSPELTAEPMLTPGVTLPELTASPSPAAMSQTDLETAKTIQADVDKLSEVAKSSVLVMGDTALIGVQFASEYKGELTTRIKDMIIGKAEAANASVTKVAVTADAQQYKRVEDMVNKVAAGTPFSEISLEMSELVNGLLPRG